VLSAGKYLDKEAIRVVSSSPLWTPGKNNGERVNVIVAFPINFILTGRQNKERRMSTQDLLYKYFLDHEF
jgi:hypothetical protein